MMEIYIYHKGQRKKFISSMLLLMDQTHMWQTVISSPFGIASVLIWRLKGNEVLSDTVTQYLNNLAEECGTRGESNDGNIYLPHRTKNEVYKLYASTHGSDTHVTYQVFSYIWNRKCPHLKVKGNEVLLDTVTQYLNNLAEECGTRGESNDGNIYLPHRTKKQVYQLYTSAHGSDTHVKYLVFLKIWNRKCPHVKVKGNEVTKDILIQFMSNLLEKYGHKTITENKEPIVLPFSSNIELYRLYQSTLSTENRSDMCLSPILFYKIRNDVFPYVKVKHTTFRSTVVHFLSTLVDHVGKECENGGIDLPYSSKREVYNLYLSSEMSDPNVSPNLFILYWRNIFPHVRTKQEAPKCST